MTYYKIILSITICIIPYLASCSGKSDASGPEDKNSGMSSDTLTIERNIITELKPDEMMFFVEGAVDSWFFYHLHDYRSYEAIIRSTEYDEMEECYIHKCRYRASTLGGGYETEEKIFKVTFDINSQGLKDFNVVDITGKKSLTEKEE